MTSLAFTAPINLAGAVTLTTHGAGTVSFAAINGTSGGLVINGGHGNLNGNINVGSLYIASAAVATVAPGGATVLRTASLQSVGKLNLNDNPAIVDYTGTGAALHPATASVRLRQRQLGRHGHCDAVAAANGNAHPTGIGYGEASTLGLTTFAGQSVDSTTVVLQYTLMGDSNLDGKVNASDFDAIARNYGSTGKAWTDGDFNYDGTVNVVDFNALAANYNQTFRAGAGDIGS